MFQPLFFKNIDLVLGASPGTQVKCQVKSVKLSPDAKIVKEKTACPKGSYSEVEPTEWELELGYLVGRDTETDGNALSEYLVKHEGELIPFAFRPWSGDHKGGWKGRVRIVPGELGGEVGEFSKVSVKLAIEGKPEPLTEPEKAENSAAVFS